MTLASSSNGLTAEERELVTAANTGPRLGAMSLSEFKHALVRPMVTAGIKTLPSDLETQLLYDQVTKYYKHISLGDFYLAFELNSLGKIWPRVEHFNLFNLAFLSDVLTRYNESQGKAINQAKKINNQAQISETKPEVIPVAERKAILKDIITEDRALYLKKGLDNYTAVLCMSLIRALYELQAVTDQSWTDKTWTEYAAKAKDKAKREALSAGYYLTDKHRYKDNRLVELNRLLYVDIIKNEQLFNDVINKL